MKETLIKVFSVIVVILLIIVVYLLLNNKSGEYHFIGEIRDEETNISVDVFIMQNNNGNLLTYSTDIYSSKEKIVSARLCYDKDGEKTVALGNGLNSYNYSKEGQDKKEYGYDYIDDLLKYPLHFELCKDSSCNEVYKTIELSNKKLN